MEGISGPGSVSGMGWLLGLLNLMCSATVEPSATTGMIEHQKHKLLSVKKKTNRLETQETQKEIKYNKEIYRM